MIYSTKELNTISTQIAQERERLGLTIQELAEKLDVSTVTVSKWENGHTYPNAENICALCNCFGCDFDYLVGRIKSRTNQIQEIIDYTGLSEKAINNLHKYKLFADCRTIVELCKQYEIERDTTTTENSAKEHEEYLQSISTSIENQIGYPYSFIDAVMIVRLKALLDDIKETYLK